MDDQCQNQKHLWTIVRYIAIAHHRWKIIIKEEIIGKKQFIVLINSQRLIYLLFFFCNFLFGSFYCFLKVQAASVLCSVIRIFLYVSAACFLYLPWFNLMLWSTFPPIYCDVTLHAAHFLCIYKMPSGTRDESLQLQSTFWAVPQDMGFSALCSVT